MYLFDGLSSHLLHSMIIGVCAAAALFAAASAQPAPGRSGTTSTLPSDRTQLCGRQRRTSDTLRSREYRMIPVAIDSGQSIRNNSFLPRNFAAKHRFLKHW
jgi:hypothetical protein